MGERKQRRDTSRDGKEVGEWGGTKGEGARQSASGESLWLLIDLRSDFRIGGEGGGASVEGVEDVEEILAEVLEETKVSASSTFRLCPRSFRISSCVLYRGSGRA